METPPSPTDGSGSTTDSARPRPVRTAARGALCAALLAALIGACGTDDTAVYVDDVVEAPTAPATTSVVVPATTTPPSSVLEPRVEIERAWSPSNAIAEITGRGADASDEVSVDGSPAVIERFDVEDDESFLVQVRIEDEGAHTVCVGDACSRVFTLAADAQSRDEVEASIEAARPIAAGMFDGEAIFPDWTIAIGGPQAGTGGSTDVETKTITIHANRGRTVDEFVTTILHEWGHVVDDERLTEEERRRYRALRGIEPSTPWRERVTHGLDDWGMQPAEDFAEVLVALWTADTDAPHAIRTTAITGPVDETLFSAVTALVSS